MEILKSLLFSAFVVLFIDACRDIHGHEKITLVNKSGDTIGIQAQAWKYMTEKDTLFEGGLASDYIIEPDSQWVFRSMNPYWEEDFTLIPYLQILIMDGDKFWQYYVAPADTVRKYVPVLCRYQLTQPDLEKVNWVITYPPTEAMKDIKMYPPYETFAKRDGMGKDSLP